MTASKALVPLYSVINIAAFSYILKFILGLYLTYNKVINDPTKISINAITEVVNDLSANITTINSLYYFIIIVSILLILTLVARRMYLSSFIYTILFSTFIYLSLFILAYVQDIVDSFKVFTIANMSKLMSLSIDDIKTQLIITLILMVFLSLFNIVIIIFNAKRR